MKKKEEAQRLEEANKTADLNRYGTFSKYWPWIQEYEKKRNSPERIVLLGTLMDRATDYYDEDPNNFNVVALKKKIDIADRYDYINAALSKDEVKGKGFLLDYINATVRPHQHRGNFDITYTPLEQLCNDIAMKASAEKIVDNLWVKARQQKHEEDGVDILEYLHTRKMFKDAPILEPWVKTTAETLELLYIEAKVHYMQELKEIFDSKDAYSANAKVRRIFDGTIDPFLKTPVQHNYFTEAVGKIIDKVYGE